MDWKVYLIYNKNWSYVGATPDIEKRIRKHNQELSGGAKYTKSKGPGWKYICYISGFQNKIDALMFEWAWKHMAPRKLTGIYGRIYKLENLLFKPKWTTKSPPSHNYHLKIHWISPEYILENFQIPEYVEQDVEDLYNN